MKKEYVKPEVEFIDLTIKDELMDDLDQIPDASLGVGGEFDF